MQVVGDPFKECFALDSTQACFVSANVNRQTFYILRLSSTPWLLVYVSFRLRFWSCTEEQLNPHIPGEIADSTGVKFISHMAASVPPNHNLDWQFNPALHRLLPSPRSTQTPSPCTASFGLLNYTPAASQPLTHYVLKERKSNTINNANHDYSNGCKGVSDPVPPLWFYPVPAVDSSPVLWDEERSGVKFGFRM